MAILSKKVMFFIGLGVVGTIGVSIFLAKWIPSSQSQMDSARVATTNWFCKKLKWFCPAENKDQNGATTTVTTVAQTTTS